MIHYICSGCQKRLGEFPHVFVDALGYFYCADDVPLNKQVMKIVQKVPV